MKFDRGCLIAAAAKFDEILSLRALHGRLCSRCERLVDFPRDFLNTNLNTKLRAL